MNENTFEGYASYFNNKDAYSDIVVKNAFKKTIVENRKRIKVLWQHNVYEPIGLPEHMEEDSKGLFVKARIVETDVGKKAMTLLREGVINEMSIGYRVVKEEYDREQKTRMLKELKLMEFSLVTFGANDKARVTNVKFENLLDELKDGEIRLDRKKIEETIKVLEALLVTDEPSNDTQKEQKSQIINDIDPILCQSILEEINKYK
jgi:HK97 family phage prohead protease